MEQAGSSSPHLDKEEQDQAADHAAPRALVIHELVREEGETELERSTSALAWSGLAAGLSMGFSLLALALIQGGLPDLPWRRLIDSFGYCMGFLIAILGRQQLFTESTMTALLPVLTRRDLPTLKATLRVWGVVLGANLIGTFIFAAVISVDGLFPPGVHAALVNTGREVLEGSFGPKVLKAVLAGWLIAVMVWMLPSARSARIFVVILVTYIVALGRFPHAIAGSVDAAFAVFSGSASVKDYLVSFLAPTLIGNSIGGIALAALLNHAPLAGELRDREDRETPI